MQSHEINSKNTNNNNDIKINKKTMAIRTFQEFLKDFDPGYIYVKSAPEWFNIIDNKTNLQPNNIRKYTKEDFELMQNDSNYTKQLLNILKNKFLINGKLKKTISLEDIQLNITINSEKIAIKNELINGICTKLITEINLNNISPPILQNIILKNEQIWLNSVNREYMRQVKNLLDTNELYLGTSNGGFSIRESKDSDTLCIHYHKQVQEYNRIFGRFNNSGSEFTLVGVGKHKGVDNKTYEVLTANGTYIFKNCDRSGHIS